MAKENANTLMSLTDMSGESGYDPYLLRTIIVENDWPWEWIGVMFAAPRATFDKAVRRVQEKHLQFIRGSGTPRKQGRKAKGRKSKSVPVQPA